MTSIDVHAALSSVAQVVLAQRRLADFIALLEPSYEQTRHTRVLCDHLEAVERGEIDRLVVMMPPRHGKTMHVSQALPAWALGRNPRRQIILASYGAELAEGNSRKARAYLRSDRWPFECTVSEESRAQNRWQTDAGGILIATGCEGGLTGYGADLLIIDDPIRDRADAESESLRERLWQWYSDVARTRLMPNGRVILCQTRWHDDDLAGRILSSGDGKRWTVLSLPAIAEEGDALGREPGEALWPERFPANALPSVERGEISSSSFSSLYQQNPVPMGGAIFAPAWFEHRYDQLPRSRVEPNTAQYEVVRQVRMENCLIEHRPYDPPPLVVIQACDSAWKTGLTNDRSCIATLASDMVDIYVTDVWFGRLQFPDLRRVMVELFEKHQPSRLYVEEASSGFALVSDLRASTGIPIIGVPPGRESKEARAESVTGFFEAGRVKFPRNATWMQELLGEFLRFPYGRHDDIVDAVCMGVRMMQEAIARVRYEEHHEQMMDGLRARAFAR
jgi:predicted phage terminase large subunit-like protein